MKTDLKPKYKRIVLKLSGEALAGDKGFGLDEEIIAGVVDQLIRVHDMGVEIGIVIGGGNFWRGRQGTSMDRTTADHMGMRSHPRADRAQYGQRGGTLYPSQSPAAL